MTRDGHDVDARLTGNIPVQRSHGRPHCVELRPNVRETRFVNHERLSAVSAYVSA